MTLRRCCCIVATGTGRDPIWANRVIGLGFLLGQISFECVLFGGHGICTCTLARWGTLGHTAARWRHGIDGDDCEDGWLSFWLLGRSTGHLLGLFSGMWRVPASGW